MRHNTIFSTISIHFLIAGVRGKSAICRLLWDLIKKILITDKPVITFIFTG